MPSWERQPQIQPCRKASHEEEVVVQSAWSATPNREANLEAEDTTPALRRRIAARITELEEAVDDRRRRATALAQEAAVGLPDVAAEP
jgi:hypothetical protein